MRKQAPTMEGLTGATRYFALVLTVLAIVTVVLQAASMGPLKNSFWGFHLYSFLPFPFAMVSWAVLLTGCIALWRPLSQRSVVSPPTGIVGRHALVLGLVLAVACGAVLWLLRSQQILLGDAHPLVNDLPLGQAFHPRQPGTMWLQQTLYQNLGGWFGADGVPSTDVARDVVAFGSVAAGVAFALVAFALGRSLTQDTGHDNRAAWLATLVLLTQGYAVLFFGYIENYAFYTLVVASYLLTALLHLQKRLTLQVAVLVYLIGLLLHLSMVGLLPSLVFLIARGIRRRDSQRDAIAAAVLMIAGLFALDRLLRSMAPDFSLWKGVGDIIKITGTWQGGESGMSYLLSLEHLRDFVNEQFLIGPVGAFFAVLALSYAARQWRALGTGAVFLSLASLSYLAGSFIMSEPLLGYARDWDLFAPAGVCYTTLGLYLLLSHVRTGAVRLLAFALVLSILQLAPWVVINHSEALTLARFKTLPLGHGRTEIVVANHYFRQRQFAESARWVEKALDINPANANAYGLLAVMSIEQGDSASAREAYIRAMQLRPDKIELHHNFALLLLGMERDEEAVNELYWLTRRLPERVMYWQRLRDVLRRLGRYDELRSVAEQLLLRYERMLEERPNDVDLIVETGTALGDLERHDEALRRFNGALEIDPESGAALFNTAMLLGRLGRGYEAKPYLERFVTLYPDHAMAGWARERLNDMTR